MYTIRWWINAEYGVHPDLKGHSGGTMSLGKGAAASKSIRHRIKSRSFTESEIIGVDNTIPGVIWTLRFLGGQGFKVKCFYTRITRAPSSWIRMGSICVERKPVTLTCGIFHH